MRIAISGTANQGKSTFIKDFIKQWPQYSTPEVSYRELAKKNDIKINKQGDKKSQEIILNSLVDNALKYKKDDCVIHDRCVYDNLAYTLWLKSKEIGGLNDEFIHKSIQIAKETAKFYDIIFFTPILDQYPIEIVPDGLRDTDPVFRSEIDYILKEIYGSYRSHTGGYFDFDDCPAVIELFGSREERIEMVKLYIDPSTGDVPTNSLLD